MSSNKPIFIFRTCHTFPYYLIELSFKLHIVIRCFEFPLTNFLLKFQLIPLENWYKWVSFVAHIAHTHLFSSAQKLPMGLKSQLCDGPSKTLTLLSLNLSKACDWVLRCRHFEFVINGFICVDFFVCVDYLGLEIISFYIPIKNMYSSKKSLKKLLT